MSVTRIDAAKLIDEGPIRPVQWRVFALCAAILLLDGYDLAALGFVVPAMAAEWGLPASTFKWALSSALLGAACGSALAGVLGDRYGRRRSLLFMLVLGAIATLATAFCQTQAQLIACRFLTGVGMAGTIPGALALASEYAPRSRRSFIVVLIVSCAALGSTVGSLLSQFLIPRWGWPSVFVVGSVIPILIALLCLRGLPESLQWLILSRRDPAGVRRLATELDPALAAAANLEVTAPEVHRPRSPGLAALFEARLGVVTPLLWMTFVLTQAAVFFLASWLSTLLTGAGFELPVALRALALLHFGGMVGGLFVSWMSDRFRPEVPLGINYFVAMLVLILGVNLLHAPEWTYVLSFLAGASVIGSAFCLSALATACYHPSIRATGLGVALGIGRTGSIMSPIIGGFALAAGVAPSTMLKYLGAAMFICSVAVMALALVRGAGARREGGAHG